MPNTDLSYPYFIPPCGEVGGTALAVSANPARLYCRPICFSSYRYYNLVTCQSHALRY